MSNTTQEFRVFKKGAEADPSLNPNLVIVDGAQGGQSAELTRVPEARYWKFVDGFPMTVTGKVRKVQMREESIAELGLA